MIANWYYKDGYEMVPDQAGKPVTVIAGEEMYVPLMMSKSGIPVMPALIKSLRDKDGFVRLFAAFALSRIDVSTLDITLPVLMAALKDEAVSHYAIDRMGRLVWSLQDDTLRQVTSALVKALNDEDTFGRGNATLALGRIDAILTQIRSDWFSRHIGEYAKDAVPPLMKALRDEREEVRNSATEVLKKMGIPEASIEGQK